MQVGWNLTARADQPKVGRKTKILAEGDVFGACSKRHPCRKNKEARIPDSTMKSEAGAPIGCPAQLFRRARIQWVWFSRLPRIWKDSNCNPKQLVTVSAVRSASKAEDLTRKTAVARNPKSLKGEFLTCETECVHGSRTGANGWEIRGKTATDTARTAKGVQGAPGRKLPSLEQSKSPLKFARSAGRSLRIRAAKFRLR